MSAYLDHLWGILLEISPFVLLGMLTAGLVHELLARFHTLRGFAMKPSVLSLSFFNFTGFILPICSCGVIPLAVGMHKQGVALGNVFTFIFSAPATSIAAVILSLAVFGPDFTLYYVAGALLCGYAVGFAFYLIDGRAGGGPVPGTVYLCKDDGAQRGSGNVLVRALRWGTVTYGSRIAFDLIIGISLAALLMTVVPVQSFASWVQDLPYWQAAMIVMAVAIPLYVCSLPGIIVGAALVLGGLTPALVWIFLMAGPVTNLGDISVLRRNLGWRSTLLYVGLVILVTFSWGWVIQSNLEWADLWAHVREYHAAQSGAADLEGGLSAALAEANWLGLPREAYLVCALLLALLTLNGARLALQEAYTSPCLHCRHFQQDMRLRPAICQHPCWKNRLAKFARRTVREARGQTSA